MNIAVAPKGAFNLFPFLTQGKNDRPMPCTLTVRAAVVVLSTCLMMSERASAFRIESRWPTLANIPADEFGAYLANPANFN